MRISGISCCGLRITFRFGTGALPAYCAAVSSLPGSAHLFLDKAFSQHLCPSVSILRQPLFSQEKLTKMLGSCIIREGKGYRFTVVKEKESWIPERNLSPAMR